MAKERNNVERTISEVASRLANSDEELTLVNTYRNLTKATNDGDEVVDHTSLVEGNLMKIDSFIAELGQPSMDLYVYDLDENLIFKTHENSRNLIQTTRKVPTIVTLEGKTGFYLSSLYILKVQEKRSAMRKASMNYLLSMIFEISYY